MEKDESPLFSFPSKVTVVFVKEDGVDEEGEFPVIKEKCVYQFKIFLTIT